MEGFVTISYSRKDEAFVKKVIAALAARQINTWLDQGDIEVGATWRRQIVDAIRGSRAVIFVLSSNSAASEHVGKELALAETAKRRLIPIVPEAIEEVPSSIAYQLAGMQRIEFFKGDFEVNIDKLVDAILRTPVPADLVPLPDAGTRTRVSGVPRVARRGLMAALGFAAALVIWFVVYQGGAQMPPWLRALVETIQNLLP